MRSLEDARRERLLLEIERINENTFKFYITDGDIEERGFDRDEIWYNREKSEELFWGMMDEIHLQEQFPIDGPLWIQVNAVDKGLEVTVTKAQVSKDGQRFEPFFGAFSRAGDHPVDDRIEDLLDHHFQPKNDDDYDDEDQEIEEEILEYHYLFRDFEDLISLSKRHSFDQMATKLYSMEGKFYLLLEFSDYDVEYIDNMVSLILEYGYETLVSVPRIEEYGKVIIEENVFDCLRTHFK